MEEGTLVAMDWYKWPATFNWRVVTTLLRREEEALWLGTRKGSPIFRPPGRPPATASGDSVILCSPALAWLPRWYRRPSESGRAEQYSCYVDVTTPPLVKNGEVSVVDLDLDVAMTWAGEVVVLDEAEFGENSARLGYPEQLIVEARRTCQDVRELLVAGAPPFDGRHLGLAEEWGP